MTGLQERFLTEVLLDFDWTAAAQRAGYEFPRQAALQLRGIPKIRAEVERLKDQLDQSRIMSGNEALAGVSEIARNDGSDRDRLAAYQTMLRYHGLLVERHEVGRAGEYAAMSDATLEAEIERLSAKRIASKGQLAGIELPPDLLQWLADSDFEGPEQ